MTDSSRKHVFFLDYMRVFAFISVLVGHKFIDPVIVLANDPSLHVTLRLLGQALLPLCQGGAAGVVVFFLTSGYIITKVLQREEPIDFLLKRAFRIYPLYMLAVLMEYLCGYFIDGVPPSSAGELISRLLLIGDFTGTPNGLHGVEWTLRIEVLFYAFMALLKAVGMFNRREHLPAVYAVTLTCLYLAPPFPDATQWTSQWTFAYVTIYAPFLIMGSLIFLAEDIKAIRARCGALIVVAFIAFLVLTGKLIPGWKESGYGLFALLIFLAFWSMRNHVSAHPVITTLANLTFSVYLMHNWAWKYIAMALSGFDVDGSQIQIKTLIVLFIVCYVLNRHVESYFNKLGSRLVKMRQTRAAIAATA